jgi:transcriptional regulator GlxA family with amidase domain
LLGVGFGIVRSAPGRANALVFHIARTLPRIDKACLSRLFREHSGESFQAYLQRLRLEKAEELLRESRLPVASISRRVGYRDVSRFGQHFRHRFGASPSRYRRSLPLS